MLTRASTRRSTRSSYTSERTRKHKVPKAHIDNIFVKNMRQQRLKKNVLKKYFNGVKNVNKLRDTGMGRVQITGGSANKVFLLCCAQTKNGGFCKKRATSEILISNGTRLNVCRQHANMYHLGSFISFFTSQLSHPSYLTGKQANGSSIMIGVPDELMKVEE